MGSAPQWQSRSWAVLSEDEKYRYRLGRRWADDGPTALFVMLNPSTADGTDDDPTIRRCVGFAKREGAAALEVVNLFGYRAKDPRSIATMAATDAGRLELVGPDNNAQIAEAAEQDHIGIIIAAWGAGFGVKYRGPEVVKLVESVNPNPVMCLGHTAAGFPKHPLYIRSNAPLVPISGDPRG